VNGSAYVYVYSGGTVSGTRLNGGLDLVYGTAVGTTINSGGNDFDFGVESGTTINSGIQVVERGASASGTTVSAGGVEYVFSGGAVSGSKLNGGVDLVFGTAIGTTVNSGGHDYVQSGGIDSATLVNNGGVQMVSAEGSALSGFINSGGTEYIGSGGFASGTTISGGLVEVASGAVTSGSLFTFALSGGGTLRLDDSQHFASTGLVAGFGPPKQTEGIDFVDIPFVSGATTLNWNQLTSGSTASGTLTVSGGGLIANITLLGQYLAGADGSFNIASDGHGGTLVSDPPGSSSTDPISVTAPSTYHL
jgi:antigen 43